MEDFYSDDIPEDTGRNDSDFSYYSNITDESNVTDDGHYYNDEYVSPIRVVTYVVLCIGLPLTLVAIRAVYSLVRNDRVTPIFIINILLSDILQFCVMIVQVTDTENETIRRVFGYLYVYGLIASVGFMVCVAMERYLLIAWPLWYRYRRTTKFSVVVCVLVWVLPLVYLIPHWLGLGLDTWIILVVLLLLPFPLLIFFLVGTLRALSAAISVSSAEKRRIVAVLVTVLLIYTLLFLPTIIWYISLELNLTLIRVSFILLKISPLADLFLYVFIRKGVVDRLLASVCCCRMDRDEDNRPAEIEMTT